MLQDSRAPGGIVNPEHAAVNVAKLATLKKTGHVFTDYFAVDLFQLISQEILDTLGGALRLAVTRELGSEWAK